MATARGPKDFFAMKEQHKAEGTDGFNGDFRNYRLKKEDCGLKRYLKYVAVFFIFAYMIFEPGCMSKSIDSLYSLPQLPEQYVQLQNAINGVLNSGADYIAPDYGDNRQAVQLQDLNYDGRDEAIAFFNVQGDNKPLKIYIFEYENESQQYNVSYVIEGDGVGIDSIAYEDLDGVGGKEIIVGWRMSAEVKTLSVYSGSGYNAIINGISYTSYTMYDMQGDGYDDIIAVNLAGAENQSEAAIYSIMKDGEVVSSSARLVNGAETIQRIKSGNLSDGKPGIYVECSVGNGTTTDIFCYSNDTLKNVFTDDSGAATVDTKRSYAIYSTDLDGDGVQEVPFPVALRAQGETSYYAVEWVSYDSKGNELKKCDTYHNYSDGWYIVLPEEWTENLSVRREDTVSGERSIFFSQDNGDEEFVDFLKISALTGEGKASKAKENGCFILKQEDDVIYVGEILPGADSMDFSVTEDTVKNNFHRYYSDWITGQ